LLTPKNSIKSTTEVDGIVKCGLRQAQKYGGIKPDNGILIFSPIDI
jgi:hypothetical protein